MIHEYSKITHPLRKVVSYEFGMGGHYGNIPKCTEVLECGHFGKTWWAGNVPSQEWRERKHSRRCWPCDPRCPTPLKAG